MAEVATFAIGSLPDMQGRPSRPTSDKCDSNFVAQDGSKASSTFNEYGRLIVSTVPGLHEFIRRRSRSFSSSVSIDTEWYRTADPLASPNLLGREKDAVRPS